MAAVTIDFEGCGNQALIQGFYNGGTDSLGNSGPNHGLTFSANTMALIDSDSGGTGSFANEPSPNTVCFVLAGSGLYINSSTGFTGAVSFWYCTRNLPAMVRVWSEINGGGAMLGEFECGPLGTNGPGDPTGAFVNWEQGGINFAGTARSVEFSGTANQFCIDDFFFINVNPAPAPTPAPTPAPPPAPSLISLPWPAGSPR